MNRIGRGLLFCLIGTGLTAILSGMALSVPGKTSRALPQVAFSKPSGFYEDEFDLVLDAGGDAIYYTLDCSEPNEQSIRYTGPIHIRDASASDNLYSAITDVCPYLKPELLSDRSKPVSYPYKTPTRPVDKATVIRAVSIDDMGIRSEVAEAVYFIGYGGKTGYDGVNIMTINTAPEGLFSEDNGIYVLGKDYIEVQESSDESDDAAGKQKANYAQRGRKWERDARVCLFNGEREMVFSERCGIRIQGGYSRKLLPKGINLYAKESYGNKGFDMGTLFGDYQPLTYLNLSSGGNDTDTLLKDYIVNRLAAGLDIVTREYVPCVVVLDGEYWGNYWLTPRFRRDYLSQKYRESPENIVVIKRGALEEGDEAGLREYQAMYRFIVSNDMRRSENYEQACALLDMQSCIDYYALELYIANADWPFNNYALWRTRNRGASPDSDCRWRWILYDVNLAMSLKDAEKDPIQPAINRDALFASLMENEEFADALYARFVSMAEILNPEKTDAFIEAYKSDMAEAMSKQYERFYAGERDAEYFKARCDSIQKFFALRYDYIIQNKWRGDQ